MESTFYFLFRKIYCYFMEMPLILSMLIMYLATLLNLQINFHGVLPESLGLFYT